MDDLALSPDDADEIAEDDPLFGNVIVSSLEDVKGMMRDAISSAPRPEDAVGAGASIAQMLQEGDQYVAKVPNEVKEGLASGDLEKMKKGATNLWNGTIRKASESKAIEAQANFEKVKLTPERLQGLQSLALQAQVRRIADKLEDLSAKIDTVLEGQHLDRVADIKTGVGQYQSAETCRDPELRQKKLVSAEQSLRKGRASLKLWLEETIKAPGSPEGLVEQLWSLIGVSNPRVERKQALEKQEEKIKEALQFYVIASDYLLKIHLILGNRSAADQLVDEHIRTVGNINDRLTDKAIPLPPETRELGRDLGSIREQLEEVRSGPFELRFSRERLLD